MDNITEYLKVMMCFVFGTIIATCVGFAGIMLLNNVFGDYPIDILETAKRILLLK